MTAGRSGGIPYTRPGTAEWRIVKASQVLEPNLKLIWDEHLGFWKKAAGCYASAKRIADRLGLSQPTVERARALFLNVGLFAVRRRGPGITASWYPRLPIDAPRADRLEDDEVAHFAERLDAHLRSHGVGKQRDDVDEDGVVRPSPREGGSPMKDAGFTGSRDDDE